jgi:hypothetical protein
MLQDFSKERREYEDRRKVHFFTDGACRSMYKSHAKAVSAYCQQHPAKPAALEGRS